MFIKNKEQAVDFAEVFLSIVFLNVFCDKSKFIAVPVQGPQSHILMTGWREGGIFRLWNFGQKGFFGVYERCWDCFEFWVAK